MLSQMPRFFVLMNVVSQDPISVEILLFEEVGVCPRPPANHVQ